PRNEQVRGSIPRGGSTSDQRKRVRQACARGHHLALLSRTLLWLTAFRTTFDLVGVDAHWEEQMVRMMFVCGMSGERLRPSCPARG
ncbi:MAG: hypothetical protein ACREI9_13085, partial [Nitrospiraceae bacterium]